MTDPHGKELQIGQRVKRLAGILKDTEGWIVKIRTPCDEFSRDVLVTGDARAAAVSSGTWLYCSEVEVVG
jgi:hypothetical protein